MTQELLQTLIKKYPNHQQLGGAVQKVFNILNKREPAPNMGLDRVEENIEVARIINKIKSNKG